MYDKESKSIRKKIKKGYGVCCIWGMLCVCVCVYVCARGERKIREWKETGSPPNGIALGEEKKGLACSWVLCARSALLDSVRFLFAKSLERLT